MQKQLQAALTDLIRESLQGVSTAKGFLTAEIPDVIHQLLLWYGIYNFMLFVAGVSVLLAIAYLNYRQFKYFQGKLTRNDELIDHPEIALNILQLMPLIFAFTNLLNLTWLKIWIVPKIWLVEYVGSLAK